LWGKFGIIATPTVIISDTNDTVLWVKVGHGYDFAPVIGACLNEALGIAQQIDPNDAGRVKTVTNATVAARIKRHLQMANILQQKGRLESAIAEVRKAKDLDPNSVQVALELGELFCRAGQNKAALDFVKRVRATKRFDRARLLLISGWAKRQAGQLDAAEELLLETTTLNPKSSRAFFELGKVYQARGQAEKAMRVYYKALVLVFDEPIETGFSRQK
jgi:tetratricopeptide (TPR) repeat protein